MFGAFTSLCSSSDAHDHPLLRHAHGMDDITRVVVVVTTTTTMMMMMVVGGDWSASECDIVTNVGVHKRSCE
jgi:hypothetical protein